MQSLLTFYKAMSDETRLRLMTLLMQRDYCVCELTEILDLSQPKISKHLAKLRDLGLVSTTRDAKFMVYQANVDDPVIKSSLAVLLDNLEHYEVLTNDAQSVPLCTMNQRIKRERV